LPRRGAGRSGGRPRDAVPLPGPGPGADDARPPAPPPPAQHRPGAHAAPVAAFARTRGSATGPRSAERGYGRPEATPPLSHQFRLLDAVIRDEPLPRRDAPQPLPRLRPVAQRLPRVPRAAVRPLDDLRLRGRQAGPERPRRVQLAVRSRVAD